VDDLPLKAAQAITLALRSDGGDVRGLLFPGSAWHTEDIAPADIVPEGEGPAQYPPKVPEGGRVKGARLRHHPEASSSI